VDAKAVEKIGRGPSNGKAARGPSDGKAKKGKPAAKTGANNYFAELGSGFEEGSYSRRIDFCITRLQARE